MLQSIYLTQILYTLKLLRAFLDIFPLSIVGPSGTQSTSSSLPPNSLLLPILTYGCDLFSPNTTMQDKMTVFWNKVLRWINNWFSSTPVAILACESCISLLF